MKISIVMTVYNGEEFVRDAVQSILNQTYRNFEFIIVDDCSTDQTRQVLAGFKDKRLKIYNLNENKGQTYSLNYGIDRASGDWIFRQDADDISLPKRLAYQVAFIKRNPDTVAVGTQIKAIPSKRTTDENSLRAIEWSNTLLTREEIKKFRFIAPPVVHGSVAFSKKAFIEAGRYNEKYRIGQDLDLWIRLLEVGPIDKVPKVLYHYRVDPESISRKDESKTCRESLTISSFYIRKMLHSELEKEPVFLVVGPAAGCDYFREEIAPINKVSISDYVNEEQSIEVILEKYRSLKVDALIILDGKNSERYVEELERAGVTFNSQVFRLWNIYIESEPIIENTPSVSVVVPCYNAFSSIRNTILSLGRQTYPLHLYEIIIVDDASTDESFEYVKTCCLPNLKVFRHPENKGAAGARNTGVSHASGEIIIFCDSDFIVPPWFIESHVKLHDTNERKIISGMGHWNYAITFNFGSKWSSYERRYVKEFYRQSFIKERLRQSPDGQLVHESEINRWDLENYSFCPAYLTDWVSMAEGIFESFGPKLEGFHLPWLSCCTGNLSIRKTHFLELGGFDEKFRRLEDWEFGYRFYQAGGKFVFGVECEALQQLSPIHSKRKHAQSEAYQLFRQKHPHFDIHLLVWLLFGDASFVQLSNIFEQHQLIKQNPIFQVITSKLEETLSHYEEGLTNKMAKTTANEKEYIDSSISVIQIFYLDWANLFRQLHHQ
ncbi:glycosyltransferase [Neobacillus drentensis]|uniref:glycosyltransferase n=1 Tax=Neobacillus drentensis TaxID=220684 RepID=UPI002862C2B2|nr:glycosyltransferase [Neobacillus drentensis]MDR7240804.1 glycosyltransferase involved in cell wall biosynthesis [Neobacillus drentensis]